MGISHKQVLERFRDGNPKKLGMRGSRVFAEGDVLYSFGHHFALAVRGNFHPTVRFLVNADRYSSSTSGHTSACITTLQERMPDEVKKLQRHNPQRDAWKPSWGNLQLSFSAMQEAGLMGRRSTRGQWDTDVQVVDFTEDERKTFCLTCSKEVKEVKVVTKAASSSEVDDGEYDWAMQHIEDGSPVCIPKDGDGKPDTREEHLLGSVLLRKGKQYWLSSIDPGDDPNLSDRIRWRYRHYFLCRLPRVVATVAEAYDSLKPDLVRTAENAGASVRRQGDIYFIPVTQKTKELVNPLRMCPVFETRVRKTIRVYGINPEVTGGMKRRMVTTPSTHYATERRQDADGNFYVRGIIRHQPWMQDRNRPTRPEHANIALRGPGWWKVVKNTALASFVAIGSTGYVD